MELPERMVPLRRRLFLVAIAALVPLGAIAAIGLVELVTRQREDAQRAGIELTRALATAVDAELGRSISVLAGDRERLGARRGRSRASSTGARSASCARSRTGGRSRSSSPTGRRSSHTGFSYGAPLPPLVDPASVERVRESTAPVIGEPRAARARAR